MKESKKECKLNYVQHLTLNKVYKLTYFTNFLDIAQLRKKFEEDKKRIETMKQNRKFKPF